MYIFLSLLNKKKTDTLFLNFLNTKGSVVLFALYPIFLFFYFFIEIFQPYNSSKVFTFPFPFQSPRKTLFFFQPQPRPLVKKKRNPSIAST